MGFHTLSIGTSALLTARYGLDVTGQNMGNVETSGYSRQRLNQQGLTGWTSAGISNAVIGTGVWTQSVRRIANEYIEKQLRQATSTENYYTNLKDCYTNIQAYFNEPSEGDGTSLSDAMSKFWNSMNDFSANVENMPVRTTALKDAEGMVARFNAIATQLKDYRQNAEEQVREAIGQINNRLQQVAVLNARICQTEAGGVNGVVANDLRDQRGEIIKELYGYMDIDVVEETNGASIISIHGRTLVYYDQVNEIKTQQVKSDDMLVTIPVFSQDYYPLSPRDGTLAGMIETRDVIIKGYQDDVNQLSGNFIWEFNRAYSQTRGLSSFDSITSLNAPMDPSSTLDKLQYRDTVPEGTFQIVNGNFEIIVHNRATNQETTLSIEVDADGRPGPNGEPDMILWDPDDPDASHALVNRLQQELDAAVPGAFKVSVDREYHLSIESTSKDHGFVFGKDTSGVLAALGVNVMFSGHNALTMGMNEDLLDNPQFMGAAYSFMSGDNAGINDILAVRDAKVFEEAGMTLDEFYLSVAGRLASEANKTSSLQTMQVDIRHRMFVQRESLSGVSEEEEASKMITYQRAFQAAAKFISTVDVLYETLINM